MIQWLATQFNVSGSTFNVSRLRFLVQKFENLGVCVKKRPEIALKMLYVSKRDLKQA